MEDKQGIKITNAFQKNLKDSNCKPNKIWVDKGSKFYNGVMARKKNDIEMCPTHNKGNSVVAERFTRALRNEIYKHMTSVSKISILIN